MAPKCRTRAQVKAERLRIIKAGVKVALKVQLNKVSADLVAYKLRCSEMHIRKEFISINNFRKQILKYAIKHEINAVIAQGIVCGYNDAKKLSVEMKRAAFEIYL